MDSIQDTQDSSLRRDLLVALGVVALAMAFRLPLLGQSLWLDEIGTVRYYADKSFLEIVAEPNDQSAYVPNNQIFHTLLVKLSIKAGHALGLYKGFPIHESDHFTEAVIRFPSFLAGSLIGVVLAWPIRRRFPKLALCLAIVISVHPWLVSYSTEARGYSLALLLVSIATSILFNPSPTQTPWHAAGYILSMGLAIYTIPMSGLALIGHGIALLVLDRKRLLWWLLTGASACLLSAVLYAPKARSIWAYYHHPFKPTIRFTTFIDQLPRYALAGMNMEGWYFYTLPVVLISAGVVFGWRVKEFRGLILTFAAASALAIGLGAAVPSAHEVRFVSWLIPLFCVALIGIFAPTDTKRFQTTFLFTSTLVFVAWAVLQWNVFRDTPPQPLAQAVRTIVPMLQPGEGVACPGLAGDEALWAYSDLNPEQIHSIDTLADWEQFNKSTTKTADRTPADRVVLVPYPELLARDHPEIWDYIRIHYVRLGEPLSGRVADTSIFSYMPLLQEDMPPPSTLP